MSWEVSGQGSLDDICFLKAGNKPLEEVNSFPQSQQQSQAGIEVSTIYFGFSDKVVNTEVGMTSSSLPGKLIF